MAQSNAERQRIHKERLKQKAAEGMALADLMLENQHALEGLITQIRQIVHQAGGRAAEHAHPPGTLSLPPAEVDRLARMKEFRSFGEDGSTEHQAFRFLGMSVQQWATMPRELLEVFGLTDVVAEWHRQPDESIIKDNERQPENAEIEEHLAQTPSPAGEEFHPLPETAEGSWIPTLEITSPKAPEPLDFQSLHRAYLQWLDVFCPHPARTIERWGWVQENLFPHDGALWRYIGRPRDIPAANWSPRYESEDGRIIIQSIEPEDDNSASTQSITAKHSDHS
ncbi:hypothetical protein [Microvirga yunnanensis]|uniref:hypothetical protein n=1 Tax=Microvirga yunnanensis TaxID=2953740 RepID=UPI0021C60E21|nr:hypothetical protein [Microvirga sp. HBU65207]